LQHFDRRREPPPPHLQGPAADRARQILVDYFSLDNEKRAQTAVPGSELDLNHPTITASLARLFWNKCAFCEAKTRTETYRFRPVAEAIPYETEREGHLYYRWLAEAWENLYSICFRCRPSRSTYFPVQHRRVSLPTRNAVADYHHRQNGLWGQEISEKPLLIDPCAVTDIWRHLSVQRNGTLVPLTAEGKETIDFFQLNLRSEERAQRFEACLEALVSGSWRSGLDMHLFDFPGMEFGGSWYILLRRVAVILGGDTGRPILSQSRIDRFFRDLLETRKGSARIRDAFENVDVRSVREMPSAHLGAQPRSSLSRVTAIRLRSFKAIERLDLDMPAERTAAATEKEPPPPALLILGENAAGKSSILEAIALCLTDDPARTELGLSAESFILNPAFLGAKDIHAHQPTSIEIDFDTGEQRKLLIGRFGFNKGGLGDSELPPIFAYGAFRQFLEKKRNYTPAKHIKSLFRTDTLISNPEAWLLRLGGDRFRMVARALRSILSIEQEFDVLEVRDGRCYMMRAVETEADGPPVLEPTPLSLVSSGFRSVLAMVCDILQGLMDPRVHGNFESLTAARAVVLIDEIEAHLHPRWKLQIMRGLREALPGVTFIATTHDPLCLRGVESGEVRVLQRTPTRGNRSRSAFPTYVEQISELPSPAKLNIEQLLTSDFFQLLSTDAPELERELAKMADLLSRSRAGKTLLPAEKDALEAFTRDVASALPVGASEVHRLVQDAVADYLTERRTADGTRTRELADQTKARIRDALRRS
jgi:hypothetical protein